MAVIATQSVQRCKICKHSRRSEIDELLEKRSLGLKDSEGQRYNLDRVRTILAQDFGVENPTEENVKNHWQKHCELVTDEDVAAQVKAAEEAVEMILANPNAPVDIEQSLKRLFALGMAEVELRVQNGQRAGITPDMLIKISDALARRGQNEAQSELLKALGGGIQDVFKKALGPTPEPAAVIDLTGIEDAEVVA